MVGSEPLTPAQWDAVGLADRPTFHDARHMIIYGQRTDDGRIAFGGRGAPYHFGSRIDPGYDTDAVVRDRLIVDACASSTRPSATSSSRTTGVGRSACRGTGDRRCGFDRATGHRRRRRLRR